jgi:AcrR family transcriptional regulator
MSIVTSLEAVFVEASDGDDPTTDRILDAAYQQLLAFGVRRFSVEDVARRAGVNRITIYRRFAGRDDLVRAVLLREGRRLFAEVDAAVDGLPTAADQLAEAFATILVAVRDHPLVQRTLATEPEVLAALLTASGTDVLVLARAYIAGHLRRGQGRGQLRAFDADVVAELVVRLGASFVLLPDSCIPLETKAHARSFVRRHLAAVSGRGR